MAQISPPKFNGYQVCPHEHDRLSSHLNKKNILIPRQQEVFELHSSFIKSHGYPPTCQELAELLVVSSPYAAYEHLRSLQRKGGITIIRGVTRGITITTRKEPDTVLQLFRELVAELPGARDVAVKFLKMAGEKP